MSRGIHKLLKKNELRDFALIWSGIFTVIAFYPLLQGYSVRVWAVSLALFFILGAFLKPEIFSLFHTYWIRLGEILGNIFSKVVMTLLYFFIFTPVSALLRLLGKDPLSKKLDRDCQSYWTKREKQPQSMKQQF